VLVAGARGFVGRALCPALEAAGHDVTRGQRPAFDVDDEASVRRALAGQDAAVWLIHGLKNGDGYAAWEESVAERFARTAKDAGVARVVYLGGLEPKGGARTRHLDARLATGRALASAGVDVVELRAGIIIGAGSESWTLARDTAARMPGLLDPPWARARQQPIALDDVVAALVAALALPAGTYEVPGPEVLTASEIVARTARLLGRRPRFMPVPFFPRKIASWLAPVVTRAHKDVSRELFFGMGLDVTVDGDGIFAHMPGHRRMTFDEAARKALAQDDVSVAAQLVEALVRAGTRGIEDGA
jgi:uncharacterized protein YbjT (DUF2867 family)